jgi:single-stranded-DNA-specific exonuclease
VAFTPRSTAREHVGVVAVEFMGNQLLFNLDDQSSPEALSSQGLPTRELHSFLPAAPRTLHVSQPTKQALEHIKRKLGACTSPALRAVAAIFAGRGVDQHPDLDSFLSPRISDLLNPSRLSGFDQAVEVISTAIREKNKIGIVGDYDVDGVTSVAQFVRTLQSANAPHQYWIPNRFKDGYGISDRIVQELIDSGCKVAVLFDNGTHAHKQIEKLKAHGIEVIVFDHHEVGETIPDCILVNPRQPGCGLHDEFPSAAGLSLLLNHRLQKLLGLPQSDLSLAALGTIADMVPLRGLNRTIARIGLSDMRRNSCVGISALARRYWVSHDDITSSDIGFLIGPAINAAGRLGDGSSGYDASLCVELLTTTSVDRAKEIADILFGANELRKQLQRSSLIDNYVRLSPHASAPAVIVSYSDSHHPGVNGLVAQGLASRYARPAFVFSKNDDGSWTGSARNGHSHFDLMVLLRAIKERDGNDIILRFGGHKAAAGITIRAGCMAEFERISTEVCEQLYPASPREVMLTADTVSTFRELTAAFVSQIEALLEPFGQEFAGPQLFFENVLVRRVEAYDGGRYMLELEQECTKRTVRAFIGPEIWNNDIRAGAVLSLIASPAQVYRNQKRFVQLSVSGYTVTGHAADVAHNHETDSSLAPLEPFVVIGQPWQPDLPLPSNEDDLYYKGSLTERETECVPALNPPDAEPADPAEENRQGSPDESWSSPLEILAHTPLTVPATRSDRNTSSRQKPKVSRFQQLKQRLADATRDFDGRYIYPELETLRPDYFKPRSPTEELALWEALQRRCDLAIDPTGLEYRPWCEEFIRYFFDNPGNHVLQAPPGSGKSEIALSIASHYRKHGKRVVMIAPTIDIVNQLSGRIKRLLSEDAIILDGGSTPPESRKAVYAFNPGFIVATPDVIANDCKSGLLSFSPSDLLIVDEAHHATGNASAVTAIKAARRTSSRILGLSATPAQAQAGKSWNKLQELCKTFEVEGVFPLNVPMHRPDVSVKHCSLPPEMLQAETHLAEGISEIRQRCMQYFSELGSDQVSHLAQQVFGGKQVSFPTQYALNPLLKALRETPEFNDWNMYQAIKAIGEIAELRQALVKQGIAAFLLRCIEKRFEISFPTTTPKGFNRPAAAKHLTIAYGSRAVETAYHQLARGPAIELWSSHEHARIMQMSDRFAWNALTNKERRVCFNKALSATRQRVITDLVARDYCNHPKEAHLLEELARHPKRTFVSTRLVDHAVFLTKRIDHLVTSRSGDVVTLTGLGRGTHKGVSRKERKSNLASFNAGEASVLVGTSAGNEGVDLVAEYGCAVDFDGSQTNARQKEGRVGRHSFGVFDYLCTTLEDHSKVNSIFYKDIAFQEMLNRERARVSAQAGLSPLAPVTPKERTGKLSTGMLF